VYSIFGHKNRDHVGSNHVATIDYLLSVVSTTMKCKLRNGHFVIHNYPQTLFKKKKNIFEIKIPPTTREHRTLPPSKKFPSTLQRITDATSSRKPVGPTHSPPGTTPPKRSAKRCLPFTRVKIAAVPMPTG
jgi:hypothetical protein